MTCLNILVQNLTCFEKLVSNCEAARKGWLKICSFFTKIFQNQKSPESLKVPTFSFSRCSKSQRIWFFESKFFERFWVSPKKFPKSVALQNISIQSLRVSKRLIRNLTRFRIFDSKFDELLKVGSTYDPFKTLVSKSDTFFRNVFKIWSLSKTLIQKICFFFPNNFLRLLLSKKPQNCHFWSFYGLNWPTKLGFWKQIS